jgi:tetratricopeptide (TPR) repeat protein
MHAPETNSNITKRPASWKWLLGATGLVLLIGIGLWRVTAGPAASTGPNDPFQEASPRDPFREVSPREPFQEAMEAFQDGNLTRLAEITDELRDVPRYEAHWHLLQGILLLRSNQPEEALQQLGLANQHPDTRALAFTLAGEIFYKVGNFRAAEAILREAIGFEPQQADAHRWLAATYYDIGAMNDAIAHLEIVSELDPADARPKRLSGLILKDFEKYSDAVSAYEESLRRNPNQQDVLVELAECLVKLRELERALEVLRDCEPSAEVWTLAAECEYSLDNQQAARRHLERVFELDPVPLEAFQLRATMALDSSDAQHAEEVLEQAVSLYPKDFGLRFKLAQAYRRLGKEAEADEQLEQSEELRELRRRFADLHDRAIQEPLDAEVRYELGVVARKLDMMELAESWFRASFALDPSFFQSRQAADAAR